MMFLILKWKKLSFVRNASLQGFDEMNWNTLNPIEGIYRLLDSFGNTLYVGSSKDIHQRLGQHSNKKFSSVVYFEVKGIQRLELEREMIIEYDPPLNSERIPRTGQPTFIGKGRIRNIYGKDSFIPIGKIAVRDGKLK